MRELIFDELCMVSGGTSTTAPTDDSGSSTTGTSISITASIFASVWTWVTNIGIGYAGLSSVGGVYRSSVSLYNAYQNRFNPPTD